MNESTIEVVATSPCHIAGQRRVAGQRFRLVKADYLDEADQLCLPPCVVPATEAAEEEVQ